MPHVPGQLPDITEYIDYVIFFNDPAEYNFAVSLIGGSSLISGAPRTIAATLGIPYPYPSGDMDAIPKGIYFIAPLTPGTEIGFPGPSGVFVDDTVSEMLVFGQLFPLLSPIPGPDCHMKWSGTLILNNGAGSSAAPPGNACSKRRFITGFETGELQLEGCGTTSTSRISKDASRVIEGRGLAVRGTQFGFVNFTTNILQPGFTTNTSWERMYVRFRRKPNAGSCKFWQTHASTAPACGAGLRFNSAGEVRMINSNSIGTENDMGVLFTPVLNQWYKLDLFFKYATGLGSTGEFKGYVRGTLANSFSDAVGFGLNGATGHVSSDIGTVNNTDREVEIDIDDWINADLPVNMNSTSLTFNNADYALDLLMGSHVRKHRIDSATLTNWSPNSFGILEQDDNPIWQQTAELTSSTSGAQIVGLTDALLQSQPDTIAIVIGAVAAVIGAYSKNAGATDGQLGYKKAGGAAVLTTINEFAGFVSSVVGYLPTDVIPTEISPFSVVYQKSADANVATVDALVANVEYIGVYGPEDDPDFEYPTSRLTFLHNSPWFNTPYGYFGSDTAFPVTVIAGTYAGNSLTTEVTFAEPPCFIWLRCTDGGGNGTVLWTSGQLGAVLTNNRSVLPDIHVFATYAGVYKMRITGASNLLNLTGKTYQYVAFCDPGMQYCLNGVFAHDSGATQPKSNALINSNFNADGGMIIPNALNTLAAGTERPNWRGPGVGSSDARSLDNGTVTANMFNTAAGILNSLVSGTFQFANEAYSLWRTTMGGGCGYIVVQLCQYTGNGAASQVVNLTPASGTRAPVFVMVAAPGSNGFYRDPSHTGANSSFNTNNGLTVNAITAVGIDQITVGSQLNTNGTVYTVFSILGGATMANGTYQVPICSAPSGGPYSPPTAIQGDINVLANGGLNLGGATALSLLKNISGIYTLIPGQRHDTVYDRQTGQTSVDVEIPDPTFKTGYVGG